VTKPSYGLAATGRDDLEVLGISRFILTYPIYQS